MNPLLLPFLLVLSLGLMLLAAVLPPGGRRWGAWAAAAAGAVLASLALPAGPAASVLALLGELAAVALVHSAGTAPAREAARRMLLAVGLGTLGVGLGEHLLAADASSRAAVTLLIAGHALKLGLVPAFFWLPAVARATPALTTALIVCVIDVNGFRELMALQAHAPAVFSDFRAVWLALAGLTLLGGALMALAQDELKPMLAFSTIDDLGYLLLGLALGTPDGLAGAWLGLLSHALAKWVLFAAVAAGEWHLGSPLSLHTRGLASRLPVASAAFMLGALAFLAVPPTLGFAGRWRLYEAAVQLGGAPLVALLFTASALGLLCYVRAIHRTWLGAPHEGAPGRPLPRAAAALLLMFAVAPLLLGLVPGRLHPAAPTAAHVALQGSPR